jgi:hypothetical protein
MARPAILLLAFLLIAAAPPPAALAPYVRGEAFEAGDYGWLRGRFPEASASEKAATAAIQAWTEQCVQEGRERLRAELAAMGIADPQIGPQPYPGSLCESVAGANLDVRAWPSFTAFSADLKQARPIADTFLWATQLAVAQAGPRGPALADRLMARPVGEQMLRFGAGWGEGAASGAPSLTPGVRAIVLSRISAAILRADHENTEYLKRIVAAQGWPERKAVGDPAAHQAWLLAQHADADPPFQLKALRLMEPMVTSGGVHRRDYAYLYDRVMLKLVGKQRYGTQMTCKAGVRLPRPLENEPDLARLRREAELDPMADYMKQMQDVIGSCPPDRP